MRAYVCVSLCVLGTCGGEWVRVLGCVCWVCVLGCVFWVCWVLGGWVLGCVCVWESGLGCLGVRGGYWHALAANCFIKICNASFPYGYEYL